MEQRLGTTWWQEFSAARAGSIHSQFRNSQEQANVAASWNIDSDLIVEYVAHYSQLNPCFKLGGHLIHQGAVNPHQALCADQALLASEFYNEYLQRLDAFHGVAATILEDGATSANLTIFRPKGLKPIDVPECDLIRVLMPHFQRAFQLHNRILGLEQKGDAAADTLEHLPIALVMLGAKGKVLQVNKAASAIFASQKGLRVTARGLIADIPSENQRLQRLVREAISTGTGRGARLWRFDPDFARAQTRTAGSGRPPSHKNGSDLQRCASRGGFPLRSGSS